MPLRRILILLVLLFVAGVTQAQTADSIQRQEKTLISSDSLSRDTTSKKSDKQDTLSKKERRREARRTQDTTEVVFKDSARLALEKINRQATIRSAIIPGWGQITNGKWWKVPIVYGGLVGVALAFDFNQRYYKHFLEEAQYRYENPEQYLNEEYAGINDEYIIQAKDYHRRNRDLSVLIGLGVYALNIIDAYVDSKMFRYDMGDDLSFRIGPSIQSYPGMRGQALGFKVAFAIP